MSRRHKHLHLKTVEDLAYGGYGIVRHDGRVVFVDGALPGEIVDLRIYKKKRDHAFARPTEFWRRRPERVGPFCRHFSECGGCTTQDLPYDLQLSIKESYVKQAFARIGKLRDLQVEPILACRQDCRFRNKLDFSFTPHRWLTSDEIDSAGDDKIDRRGLGFHVPGRFDRVLDVETCYLQPEPANSVRRWVREYAKRNNLEFYDPHTNTGLLRSLIVRTSLLSETMIVPVFGEDRPGEREALLDALLQAFPQLTSVSYILNTTKHDAVAGLSAVNYAGRPYIRESCGPLVFRIFPESFYQTNPEQAVRLYALVSEWADLASGELVYDLFCGLGSIGLFLIAHAAGPTRIVGVESVAESVEGARRNAADNKIDTAEFVHGPVETVFTEEFIALHGRPDLVVVDPPRSGLHASTCELLARQGPARILYVSCNPSTQARDARLLEEAYDLMRLKPVDMFPQTNHIETLALFERR